MATDKLLKRRYNHDGRHLNLEFTRIYEQLNILSQTMSSGDLASAISMIDGNLTVEGNLTVKGSTNLQASVDIDAALNVDDTITCDGFTVDGDVDINGNADISEVLTLSKASGNTITGITTTALTVSQINGTVVFSGAITGLAGITTTTLVATTHVKTDDILENTASHGVDFSSDIRTDNIKARTDPGTVTIGDGSTTTDLHVEGDLTVDGSVPSGGAIGEEVRVKIARSEASGSPGAISVSDADFDNWIQSGLSVHLEFSVKVSVSGDLQLKFGTISGGIDTGNNCAWRTIRWRSGASTGDSDNATASNHIQILETTGNTGWLSGRITITRSDQDDDSVDDWYCVQGEVVKASDSSTDVVIGRFGGTYDPSVTTLETFQITHNGASVAFTTGSYLEAIVAKDI